MSGIGDFDVDILTDWWAKEAELKAGWNVCCTLILMLLFISVCKTPDSVISVWNILN